VRKLWPPTYDRISIRIWAIFGSVAINLLLWTLLLLGSEGAFYWMIPGLIPAFALGAMFDRPEGTFVPIVGVAVFIIGNFGFYYLVSWGVINMFTPSKNWWPEKRT